MKRLTALLALLLSLALSQPSLPILAAADAKTLHVSLTVDAADVPNPALRYALFYDVLDQTPGNAALAYSRSIRMIIQHEKWKEDSDRCQKWLGLPLNQLPDAEVVAMLNQHANALAELMKATRYDRCDWEVPIRTEGVGALLPHLSELRSAARLLALDIRRCLRQGRVEDAVARLRAGLAMARHTQSGSLLIEGLVGVAITQQMLGTVEDFMQQPGAPNLYWALTDFPPSFITFWGSTVWERSFVFVHFPVLREIGQRPITAADLRSAATALRSMGGPIAIPDAASEATGALSVAGMGWLVYPRARLALASQGMSATQLGPMSAPEIIVRYIGGAYIRQRDNFFRWAALPYPQARKGLTAAEDELPKSIARDPIENVIVKMVFPAMARAADRFAELDRAFATLRCIEAIRCHVSHHNRQWPDSLAAIQEMPVPVDPMTGLPFIYRVEGAKAIIEAPPVAEGAVRRSKTYELTLRP